MTLQMLLRAAFPGSDIRAFIGPFMEFNIVFKLRAYSVTNYDLKVTK